jgi:uncharacterized membrane protein
MKTVKIIALYLLVAFYIFMGSMHFIKVEQYYAMMPSWLPSHSLLIALSGGIEIALAILLIPTKTRTIAAQLIIAMLVVFLLAIHIPQSINYYKTDHPDFTVSMIRLPIQFLFMAWAWAFIKD